MVMGRKDKETERDFLIREFECEMNANGPKYNREKIRWLTTKMRQIDQSVTLDPEEYLKKLRETASMQAWVGMSGSILPINPAVTMMINAVDMRKISIQELYAGGPVAQRATEKETSARVLFEAQQTINSLAETLERIKEEPLLLQRIDRISKDGKHAYVKKGDIDLRIKTCPKLVSGDEVLLHPKTFQIVEHLGRPPLEVSPFAPSTIPNVSWSDIGGLEEAKADLIEAIELPITHKELFAHHKKPPIKGILLAGPPGCGKTMLGKAAATSLAKLHKQKSTRTGFLYVKGPEILNMYVGATEQTIRDLFYDAKRHKEEFGYPAIIFLDEADAILATRGNGNAGIGNTIVPQFLTEMDGLEESTAIVIIATNRPDILDPAIVRDGRIDRKVTVTRPDKNNAAEILALNLDKCMIHGDKYQTEIADTIAEEIYKDPKLCLIVSGAMLANIVHLAISEAVKRDMETGEMTGVTLGDAQKALVRVKAQSEQVTHDLPNKNTSTMMAVMMEVPNEASTETIDTTPKPTRH